GIRYRNEWVVIKVSSSAADNGGLEASIRYDSKHSIKPLTEELKSVSAMAVLLDPVAERAGQPRPGAGRQSLIGDQRPCYGAGLAALARAPSGQGLTKTPADFHPRAQNWVGGAGVLVDVTTIDLACFDRQVQQRTDHFLGIRLVFR